MTERWWNNPSILKLIPVLSLNTFKLDVTSVPLKCILPWIIGIDSRNCLKIPTLLSITYSNKSILWNNTKIQTHQSERKKVYFYQLPYDRELRWSRFRGIQHQFLSTRVYLYSSHAILQSATVVHVLNSTILLFEFELVIREFAKLDGQFFSHFYRFWNCKLFATSLCGLHHHHDERIDPTVIMKLKCRTGLTKSVLGLMKNKQKITLKLTNFDLSPLNNPLLMRIDRIA